MCFNLKHPHKLLPANLYMICTSFELERVQPLTLKFLGQPNSHCCWCSKKMHQSWKLIKVQKILGVEKVLKHSNQSLQGIHPAYIFLPVEFFLQQSATKKGNSNLQNILDLEQSVYLGDLEEWDRHQIGGDRNQNPKIKSTTI